MIGLWLIFALAPATLVKADWALWWPGWNPSWDMGVTAANQLGVDGNGRTTWELVQGAPTGPSTIPSDYTITVVAGASDVSYAFTDTTYNVGGAQYCTMIGPGTGVCNDEVYGSAATYTINTVTTGVNVAYTGAPAAAAAVKRTETTETTVLPTPPPSRMRRAREERVQ